MLLFIEEIVILLCIDNDSNKFLQFSRINKLRVFISRMYEVGKHFLDSGCILQFIGVEINIEDIFESENGNEWIDFLLLY